MLVIPALDIMGGKCVRLVQGNPTKPKVYFDSPLEAAEGLEDQGAEIMHLIDLDAALGSGHNLETIEAILRRLRVKVQVGGGIRTLEKAEALLKLGAFRVIFGTIAVQNPMLVKEAVRRFGSKRVAGAVDEKNNKVTIHGWRARLEIDYLDLARSFEELNVGTIIYTSTSLDGTLRGPPIEKIKRVVETIGVSVVASGGIGSIKDLATLARTGVDGAIVGTALYEGNFTLNQAMNVVKNVS